MLVIVYCETKPNYGADYQPLFNNLFVAIQSCCLTVWKGDINLFNKQSLLQNMDIKKKIYFDISK